MKTLFILLSIIALILPGCEDSTTPIEKPVDDSEIKIVNDLVEKSIIKKAVFGKTDIEWCTVPVPSSVPMQSQTHPSIVYVKNGWKGYTHWLGATPYPNADSKYENPCIYHANLTGSKIAPILFTPIEGNPIAPKPNVSAGAFNSDIELFLEHDTLFSLIRETGNGKYIREIKVQYSTNGDTWSLPKHVYSNNDAFGREILSPGTLKIKDSIYIYHLNGNAGVSDDGICTTMEIMSGTNFSNPDFKFLTFGHFINKDNCKIEPWHLDLLEYQGKSYILFCGKRPGKGSLLYTYLATSKDNINFYIFKFPLISAFACYRPTGYIDENGILNLYFSVTGDYAGDGSDKAIGFARISFKQLIQALWKLDELK